MSSQPAAPFVVGEQQPRISNVPPYVSSAGDEAIELAAMAGLMLDPWQQMVLRHSLGERADGRWAAQTVGLVVGRQNGKNAVLEARELAEIFLLDGKVVIHSAHEQATSSEHFRRLLSLIEGVPEFKRRVLRVSRGKGAEAIELRGGQRILFKTRTGGGGRGFSVGLIVFDEAMILSAAAKAALIPTQAAQSMHGNTQTWYAASAVDQLNPKHDGAELTRIRVEAMAGNKRIAYFEWSAEGDDPAAVPPEIASDQKVWAQANPGLGIRIAADWVEHERTVELGAREFAVERLGIGDWPDLDNEAGSVIPIRAWLDLTDRNSKPLDPVCFAVDVSPDRVWASITVAGKRGDGKGHVEVVDRRRGTGWVVERVTGLAAKHKTLGVVVDERGPASSLLAELDDTLGCEVRRVNSTEYAQACGLFFDAVEQGTLRHLGTPELVAAVKGATNRPLGEQWAWSRKNSTVDITPLVAATLAHWGMFASGMRPVSDPVVVWA